MADLKISQLSDGGASQATDEYVVARSGANYRIDGASVAAAATSVGTLSSLTISGDLTVDTSTLKVDSANNRVGIGTASPDRILTVAGTNALMNLKAANTGYSDLYFSDAAGDPGYLSYDHNTDSLTVGVNGSARLSISSAGNLAVDTNTLYVDATNNRVGIGTASPSYALDVIGTASIGGTGSAYTRVSANGGITTLGVGAYLAVQGSGNPSTGSGVELNGGANPFVLAYNRDGSAYLPLTLDGSSVLFKIAGSTKATLDASGNLGLGVTPSAWDSSWKALDIGARSAFVNNGTGNTTDIWHNAYVSAGGNPLYKVTAAATFYRLSGGQHLWYNAPSGTAGNAITFTQAMTLDASGNLLIGGTASRGTTVGTNHLSIFNGTAPAGTLTNGISLYSSAGEAYVMDAAGNATLFSPHDAETNEWIFRSKHTPTGKVLKIDVEKMLRFINDHFGLDAIHEFVEG